MGAMADAFVAYAQPLLDQTDGSLDQMNKAFAVSQFCYNLAIFPEEHRSEAMTSMQSSLAMNDEEFEEFQQAIIVPMIQRHHEMFPLLHQRKSSTSGPLFVEESRVKASAPQTFPSPAPAPDRYGPCPCQSGKKYKFCCGMKGR